MTIPTLRRPGSARAFVLEAIGALTAPRADVQECDARVSALLAGSRIAGWFSAVGGAGARAADSSAAVGAWRRLRESLRRQSLTDLREIEPALRLPVLAFADQSIRAHA